MRERTQNELREVKENLRRSKENERELVKSKSLIHKKMIKRRRDKEMERKGNIIRDLKEERRSYLEGVAHSRMQE